jgi:hypothetical protein
MRGSISKTALMIAAAGGLTLLGNNARATVLFTTSSDFTGWSPATASSVAINTVGPSTNDVDGSTTNGAGNDPGNSGGTLGAGQTSPGGSLQMTWNATVGNFNSLATAPGEVFNPAFMAAIDPGSTTAFQPPAFTSGATVAFSGTIQMVYSIPDNNAPTNGFFELGVDLAYNANGFFQTFFPTSTVSLPSVNGLTLVQATIPYTITGTAAAPDLTGFGFGIEYNSNFAPTQPIFVDSIQVVPNAAAPEPASLGCLAIGSVLMLRRRRHA